MVSCYLCSGECRLQAVLAPTKVGTRSCLCPTVMVHAASVCLCSCEVYCCDVYCVSVCAAEVLCTVAGVLLLWGVVVQSRRPTARAQPWRRCSRGTPWTSSLVISDVHMPDMGEGSGSWSLIGLEMEIPVISKLLPRASLPEGLGVTVHGLGVTVEGLGVTVINSSSIRAGGERL